PGGHRRSVARRRRPPPQPYPAPRRSGGRAGPPPDRPRAGRTPLRRPPGGDPDAPGGLSARHRSPRRPLRPARRHAPRAGHGHHRPDRRRYQADHRTMSVTIKSAREIETMAAAGRIVAGTLALVRRHVRPGVSTADLDRIAEDFIRSHPGARPSFKGLYDFPATLCTSINAEIVHGIPSPRRVLAAGDLLSVDVGVWVDGLHADSAATFPVGEVSPEARRLLAVTQQ